MKIKLTMAVIWFVFIPNIQAAEKINLSVKDQTKITDKEWVCEWKSRELSGYSGEYIMKFEKINETELAGILDNSACPGEVIFNGKLKNEKLTWKVNPQISPCRPLTVKAKFTRDKASELIMRGSYQAVCPHGTEFLDAGPVVCSQW